MTKIIVSNTSGAVPTASDLPTINDIGLNYADGKLFSKYGTTTIAGFNNSLKLNDGVKAIFGTSDDSSISHSGTTMTILNTVGNLYINNSEGDSYLNGNKSGVTQITVAALSNSGGAYAALYQNGEMRLKTYSGGVLMTSGAYAGSNKDSVNKFNLWNGDTSYCIGMANGYNYGGLAGHANTFTMKSDGQGWLWRKASQSQSEGIMALSITTGDLTLAGGVNLSDNAASVVYNDTTESIDFVFA